MATELICPDCGGLIGGDDSDPRPKCQCQIELNLSDDTEVEGQAIEAPPSSDSDSGTVATPAAPKVKKVCIKCGKDVTSEKRAKDVRGYWCWDCHRADLRRERGKDKPMARCPQCGRLVPADSITIYHGNTMCTKCRIEQDELPNHQKLKFKLQIDETEARRIEKRRTYVMLGVLFVLAVLIVISRFRH